MDHDDYLAARRQEEAHAASAAMQLCGVSFSVSQIKSFAQQAAGECSDLTIMAAMAAFFRAASHIPKPAPFELIEQATVELLDADGQLILPPLLAQQVEFETVAHLEIVGADGWFEHRTYRLRIDEEPPDGVPGYVTHWRQVQCALRIGRLMGPATVMKEFYRRLGDVTLARSNNLAVNDIMFSCAVLTSVGSVAKSDEMTIGERLQFMGLDRKRQAPQEVLA